MKIGQVADQAGVNIQTIRYYERMRLLSPLGRSDGGYRRYGPAAVGAVRFIKRAQSLGFSLKEVSTLMNLRVRSANSCQTVAERAETKIKEVEAKIHDLRRLKKALEELKTSCSRRRQGSDCPILAALEQ